MVGWSASRDRPTVTGWSASRDRPTVRPTVRPTDQPSPDGRLVTTEQPSDQPSDQPTNRPTNRPTVTGRSDGRSDGLEGRLLVGRTGPDGRTSPTPEMPIHKGRWVEAKRFPHPVTCFSHQLEITPRSPPRFARRLAPPNLASTSGQMRVRSSKVE